MDCWLCGVSITPENNSKEHVIPQAIGGRKTVSGFICRRCNNETGAEWDAGLMKSLEFMSIFEKPSRGDGKLTPSVSAIGDDGLEYLIEPGGRPKIKHARVQTIESDEGETTIHMTSGSEKEARKVLEKLKSRRYPDIDIEKEMANATWANERPRLTTTIEWNLSEITKSAVKSALALTCSNGVIKDDCQSAIEYLERPFSWDNGTVFITDKPPIYPSENWHSIFVMSVGQRLISYVTYYNALHFLAILSQDYRGGFVAMSYAVDPVSGMDFHSTNWLEIFGIDDSDLQSV